MKYSAKLNYAFNPTAGTLDFTTADPSFDVRNLYAVVNISTNNAPIYLQGVSGYGAAIDATKRVLTLSASLAGMNSTDLLVFSYDEGNDNLRDLYLAATGQQDPRLIPSPQGLTIGSAEKIEDLLKTLIATTKVLTRATFHMASMNDDLSSSIDSEKLEL